MYSRNNLETDYVWWILIIAIDYGEYLGKSGSSKQDTSFCFNYLERKISFPNLILYNSFFHSVYMFYI